jgi:hypothetical protein
MPEDPAREPSKPSPLGDTVAWLALVAGGITVWGGVYLRLLAATTADPIALTPLIPPEAYLEAGTALILGGMLVMLVVGAFFAYRGRNQRNEV